MDMWIVGKVVDDKLWEFQGVFDDEQRAVAACKGSNYFVGPARLNEELLIKTIEWPGAYYPGNGETFDPMRDVPETDEQAKIALQRDGELLTKLLVGFYETYRAEGKAVLEAFKLALEAHVAAYHSHARLMQDKEA